MAKPKAPRPSRKPELFSQLYQIAAGQNAVLGTVLSGHLVIEFLLVQLAAQGAPQHKREIEELSHSKLIDRNLSLGTVGADLAELLRRINALRNCFAHEIGFRPTLEEWKELYRAASQVVSDSTDGISQGLDEMNTRQEHELEQWVFAELFIQTAYH